MTENTVGQSIRKLAALLQTEAEHNALKMMLSGGTEGYCYVGNPTPTDRNPDKFKLTMRQTDDGCLRIELEYDLRVLPVPVPAVVETPTDTKAA